MCRLPLQVPASCMLSISFSLEDWQSLQRPGIAAALEDCSHARQALALKQQLLSLHQSGGSARPGQQLQARLRLRRCSAACRARILWRNLGFACWRALLRRRSAPGPLCGRMCGAPLPSRDAACRVGAVRGVGGMRDGWRRLLHAARILIVAAATAG